MRHIIRLLTLAAFILFPGELCAQEAGSTLAFDSCEYDFGQVQEADGTLFHTFHFFNGSQSPVQIFRVSASCSCVSVSYPQGRIAGGASGEVSIAFNPARTMGDVLRMVDIYLNDGEPEASLVLKAHVIPSEYALEDVYTISLPDGIRLSSLSQRFGYVEAGSVDNRRIEIVNSSDSFVTVDAKTENKGGLLSVACPQRLGPGEAGSIILTYSIPDGIRYLGRHEDLVNLLLNGRPCNRQIVTSCIGIGKREESRGHSPSLQVQPSSPVMRKSLLGKSFRGSFTIRNTGAADLVILKADMPEDAVTDLPDGTSIEPGGSRKVTIGSREGVFRFGLISNDPSRPFREIGTAL